MSLTKRCTKCGEVKSLDEFHRDRSKPLDRRSDCRACQREYHRTWREANRDRQREYQRAWREANRDRHREANRAWYAANRERRLEYVRAWREANRDRVRERRRAWYEANRERWREYVREHYAANRDRYYEYEHRRRARKRAATLEEFTPADVYAWWESLGIYGCFWCGLPFAEGDRIHVDHVWPLSRGGHHAVRNLVPACERCNLAKHASLPHEFAERAYREWLTSTSE